MALSRIHFTGVLLTCVFIAGGCTTYQYEALPLNVEQSTLDYNRRSLDDPSLHEFMSEYGYPQRQWPLSSWDLQALTLAGYYFNPDLQVAIARHEKSLVNEEVTTLYPNPGIQIPLEHHSDTPDGISPWLIGIVFDLIFERSEKREARYDKARAESDITRIEILQGAWQIYKSVRQAWLDHFAAISTKEFLERKLETLNSINSILSRSFELGQASEFEINAMRLELQRAKLELVNQDVQVTESLHRLASEIGIPVSALDGKDLGFSGIDQYLDSEQLNDSRLQKVALTHRLDMQHALSEYAAFESALKLEIQNQYPDITLSPGFIFDQGDNIWTLGASWVIPLLHPQNQGPIKLALADREIKQAEIISLQTSIINQIKQAQSRIESTSTALQDAELLMQEATDRNSQVQRQYELGYIDNLAVLRSKLELHSIERALVDFQINVINAAFNYEDVVQYPLLDIPGYKLSNDTDINARITPDENN
ncbi:MAG TPA: TolC family protein [Gammaproteobacteria bacterium]|nr:TolC family protein [Gammaproteobacteria bacterium]